MQQIVLIHGGSTFLTDLEYIQSLKSKTVSLEYFKLRKTWSDTFQDDLGESYDVLQPRMPNSGNAKYEEWKIWFERLAPLLDDGAILIGHSLGGIFLPKYLSENHFPKKIKATILISPPFGDIEGGETLATFNHSGDLSGFVRQAGKIIVFHSKDDNVVPISHLEMYKSHLPDAKYCIFEDRKHFGQMKFPELLSEIKALA